MIHLYYKQTCRFSRNVLAEIDRLNIKVKLKDIIAEPEYLTELMDLGGKKQTPFIHDDATDIKMYESADIIAYLQNTNTDSDSSPKNTQFTLHQADAKCA
ncbi:glutathione S-transferase N-terminal domain-containing protein [Candidatus Kaiserbacteria bacterium]|nr:glutathione S-transferase N-terminal domain-containing protein [Candidatus Kaiserbacteria bacterium]